MRSHCERNHLITEKSKIRMKSGQKSLWKEKDVSHFYCFPELDCGDADWEGCFDFEAKEASNIGSDCCS